MSRYERRAKAVKGEDRMQRERKEKLLWE